MFNDSRHAVFSFYQSDVFPNTVLNLNLEILCMEVLNKYSCLLFVFTSCIVCIFLVLIYGHSLLQLKFISSILCGEDIIDFVPK